MELGSPRLAEAQAGEAEQGYTVMHNHFIVTNVPASEVSKVGAPVLVPVLCILETRNGAKFVKPACLSLQLVMGYHHGRPGMLCRR